MSRPLVAIAVIAISYSGSLAQETASGSWTGHEREEGFQIWLVRTDKGWQHSGGFVVDDIPKGDHEFLVTREAGAFVFEGKRKGDKAAGLFSFTPNDLFRSQLEGLGYGPFGDDELFLLAAAEAQIKQIEQLPGLGYPSLSNDEFIDLHVHEAVADRIIEMRDLGFTDLSVDDLLSSTIHDVTSDFVNEMRLLVRDEMSLEELIAMRIHDVTPEFVRSIRALGYDRVTVDELLSLRIHDVTIDFVRQINDLTQDGKVRN